jgi:hypothetical protein
MRKAVIFIIAIILFYSCNKEQDLNNLNHNLPIININIDERYLWDPDSGLYVVGYNGISYETCPFVANYNQKWEYPSKISYTLNNKIAFEDSVGLRIKGTCSRGNSMKSFGIYWRKKYGNRNLLYPIFNEKPIAEYKRLFLRNSGNDFGKSHIKDASIIQIIKDYANVEFQDYQPCVLYLNDEYWGIYNIRDMITPHHFENHYNIDNDKVDLLEGSELSPQADDGVIEDYMSEVVNFLQHNNISLDANYQSISERIDIDSYIDYIIVETYISNGDWPDNNAKWWRDNTSSNHRKWKWIIADTDLAFKIENVNKVWIGSLYGKSNDSEKEDGFFIFNKLIRNNHFKEIFLNRYLFFVDTVFEKERVENIFKQIQSKIELEYPNHQKKWNLLSIKEWNKEIEDMIGFNNTRHDKMKLIINELLNEKR